MKRFAVGALVVCACLALAGCGTAVPDVKGKTVAQAQGAIVAAGFQVGMVSYDEKSIGTLGSIISQTPESGTSAKQGSAVALAVSGPPPVPAPALLGLDKPEAEAALTSVGLSLGVVTESYDASATPGVVASQTPAPGADAAGESSVAIVISKGPEPVAVPSAKGKTQSEATALLQSAAFRVKVVKKADRAKKGIVFAQKPAGGVALPGSEVVISVSTGVQLVKVANMIGSYDYVMPWGTGRTTVPWRRLTSKGFRVHTITKSNGEGGGIWLKIYKQSPAAGALAPRGSTVTVWILTP